MEVMSRRSFGSLVACAPVELHAVTYLRGKVAGATGIPRFLIELPILSDHAVFTHVRWPRLPAPAAFGNDWAREGARLDEELIEGVANLGNADVAAASGGNALRGGRKSDVFELASESAVSSARSEVGPAERNPGLRALALAEMAAPLKAERAARADEAWREADGAATPACARRGTVAGDEVHAGIGPSPSSPHAGAAPVRSAWGVGLWACNALTTALAAERREPATLVALATVTLAARAFIFLAL